MMANVCGREKQIRLIAGIILFLAGLVIGGAVAWIMGVVGVILILTSLFSYCPVNQMLSRNSCRVISNR